MFCSISGSVPEQPVISTKSGHLFEKSLIEKYIKETGKCPITQELLSLDDLLALKVSKHSTHQGRACIPASHFARADPARKRPVCASDYQQARIWQPLVFVTRNFILLAKVYCATGMTVTDGG